MPGEFTDGPSAIAAAKAEVAAREENEVVTPTPEAGWDLTLVPYACECGDPDCAVEVRLTVEEYEGIRANSKRFFVVPGHVFAEAERVVATFDRYEVVEKIEEAATIAKAEDPRS